MSQELWMISSNLAFYNGLNNLYQDDGAYRPDK